MPEGAAKPGAIAVVAFIFGCSVLLAATFDVKEPARDGAGQAPMSSSRIPQWMVDAGGLDTVTS